MNSLARKPCRWLTGFFCAAMSWREAAAFSATDFGVACATGAVIFWPDGFMAAATARMAAIAPGPFPMAPLPGTLAAAAGAAFTGRAGDLTAPAVPAVLALDFVLLADACGPLTGLRGTALSFWSGREGPFAAPTALQAPFLLAAAAELAVRPAVCA